MLNIATTFTEELKQTVFSPRRLLKLLEPGKIRHYLRFHWIAAKAGWKWEPSSQAAELSRRLIPQYQDYLQLQAMKLDYLDLSGHESRFRSILRDRLAQLSFVERGRNVLCLGARLGAEVAAFSDLGCFAVGVDLNPGRQNRWVLYGDFHRLQVASNSVDILYSNSIDHCFSLELMAAEMRRVLKPSGHIVVEPDPGYQEGRHTAPDTWQTLSWRTIEDLRKELERFGLKLISRRPFQYPRDGEQLVFVAESREPKKVVSADRALRLTVAIPTFRREGILVRTIQKVLDQTPKALEVLVLDQSPSHDGQTETALRQWDSAGAIRWVRLGHPSIPATLNTALALTSSDVILFLDDDVIPAPGLLEAHFSQYQEDRVWAVCGQVLQPGELPAPGPVTCPRSGFSAYLDYPFNSSFSDWVKNGMAGNLSVRRQRAIEAGGFDENFTGTAFRFETDFCRRLSGMGGLIRFEARASVRHLRASSGGTRAFGNHLDSHSPAHGVGDYYFALVQGITAASLRYMATRPFREVMTRFHLRCPWRIPLKLVGEIRSLLLAIRLVFRGPRHLQPGQCMDIPEVASSKSRASGRSTLDLPQLMPLREGRLGGRPS